MNDKIKKIGILTGGGSCPGLNAVIRAVTKAAIANYGYEVIGYSLGTGGFTTTTLSNWMPTVFRESSTRAALSSTAPIRTISLTIRSKKKMVSA